MGPNPIWESKAEVAADESLKQQPGEKPSEWARRLAATASADSGDSVE